MTISDLDQENAGRDEESGIRRRTGLDGEVFQDEVAVRTLVESLSDGCIVIDPAGTILLVNTRAEQLFGYSGQELLGKPHSFLIPERFRRLNEDREPHRLELPDAAGQLRDLAGLRRDGSEFPLEITLGFIETLKGVLFLAMVSDPTLREGESSPEDTRFRLSEARYRALYRDNPTMIVTIDTEFTILSVNPVCLCQLGYTEEELEGEPVLKLFHEDDHAAVTDQIIKCFQNPEQVYRWQFRKIRKDGGLLWVEERAQGVYDLEGKPIVLVLCQDITSRKRAEEALRESDARFQAIFNLAAVGIAQVGLNGSWLLINEKLCDILGYRCEELQTLTVSRISHPDDAARHLAQVGRLLAGEIAGYAAEKRYIRKDGSIVWVNLNVTLVRDSGQPRYFIAVVEDISERKRVTEELQQANKLLAGSIAERTAELTETVDKLQNEFNERTRMEHALQAEISERLHVQAELAEKELLLLHQSRLAAMGEMIGNIAHQWRQPLNLLALIAQELPMTYKKGLFDTEYLDATVRKMLETIRHMSQTIDDFRNFFRPLKEKVDFRVHEIVDQAISLLEGSLKALEITTSVVSSCDPVVNGYPNEFSQVLLNIMINARDAFSAHKAESPTITLDIGTNGGRCVVTVTDNAGGIPEEVMDRIFDPYFTTKGADKGTGLGLFMAKTIIEKNMGGSLSARNIAGGAQFRIEI